MSKLINISDEIYDSLTKMKGSESYSKIIKNLISQKPNTDKILSLAGKSSIDSKEINKIKELWNKW